MPGGQPCTTCWCRVQWLLLLLLLHILFCGCLDSHGQDTFIIIIIIAMAACCLCWLCAQCPPLFVLLQDVF